MKQKELKFYFFTNTLNDAVIKNITKFTSIGLIFREKKDINNEEELKKLRKLCKKKNIPFYIADNYRLAIKYNANGVFLTNKYRKNIPFKHKINFKIIGSAHSRLEYFKKISQNCETIMLSPLFYNKKYSLNSVLGVSRFNLMTLDWKSKVCALGGVNIGNLKKIKMTKCSSVAFILMINDNFKSKKPVYYF